MRKTNSFQDTATTGRVILDLGDGTTLDTDRLKPKDTGWRALTVASGTAKIRRVGDVVELSIANFRPATTGDNTILQMPAGFLPNAHVIVAAQESASLRIGQALSYAPYDVKVLGIAVANSWVSLSFVFTTNNAWPATLPGTAA